MSENAANRVMRQQAPYPTILADLVAAWQYKPGWQCWLTDEERGDDNGGLTLTILSSNPDSYQPDLTRRVRHLFIVPAATYNVRSWARWLMERVLDVERHEAAEFLRFEIDGVTTRPWAPLHGPGNDPYFLYTLSSDAEQRTLQDGTTIGRERQDALHLLAARHESGQDT